MAQLQNGRPSRRRKMTLAEIRANVERMRSDPKILAMIREGFDAQERGEGVRWDDLKPKHAQH